MAYENKSVQRHQIADYLDIGTAAIPNITFLGTGVTKLDENPNAQTKESKYINNASKTKMVTGYQTSFPFEMERIKNETALEYIRSIPMKMKTGGDAESVYYRVELTEPAGTNIFYARKFPVSIEVSGMNDTDGNMGTSGNFNLAGVMVEGTFNTVTKVFTQTTAVALEAPTSVPLADATAVARASTVVLTFGNKIVSDNVTLINTTAGTIVEVTKSWDSTGKILTITPTANMAATSKYEILIANIVDEFGQTLATAVRYFTTAA